MDIDLAYTWLAYAHQTKQMPSLETLAKASTIHLGSSPNFTSFIKPV